MSVHLDHGDDELDELHEINVTPFIDVMLVLLIIFMIAAPLATVDMAVDLPAAKAERSARPDKPLILTLKSDLGIMVGNDAVARASLASALDTATGGDKDAARVPARRQGGAVWRSDGADERVARRRLSACGAGRPRRREDFSHERAPARQCGALGGRDHAGARPARRRGGFAAGALARATPRRWRARRRSWSISRRHRPRRR